MAPNGRPAGSAGRAPRDRRSGASRQRRSRAALPTRTAARAEERRRTAHLTARAAILAVALVTVVLALALPFKVWVAQRGEIAALQSQTKEQERRVAQLREQQERWNDPAYVTRQARVRLHYAMPGERTYVVLGEPKVKKRADRQVVTAPALTGPWYSRLWQSVEVAGDAGTSS